MTWACVNPNSHEIFGAHERSPHGRIPVESRPHPGSSAGRVAADPAADPRRIPAKQAGPTLRRRRYSAGVSDSWPAVGPAHEFDAFVEPMVWGSATYTVVRVPAALDAAARAAGTRRVEGELDGVPVNLALTRAPVIDDVFVWAGASLLRRLRLEPGDPVHGRLAPVDPDHVPIPSDLAATLSGDALRRWEELKPADRRRRLVPLDAAATATTRQRRLAALLDSLGA